MKELFFKLSFVTKWTISDLGIAISFSFFLFFFNSSFLSNSFSLFASFSGLFAQVFALNQEKRT